MSAQPWIVILMVYVTVCSRKVIENNNATEFYSYVDVSDRNPSQLCILR